MRYLQLRCRIVKGEVGTRYNVQITKNWSLKPVKEEKDRSYLHQMVKETTESAGKSSLLEKPLITKHPKNIASIAKPNKKEVIENQVSRLGK